MNSQYLQDPGRPYGEECIMHWKVCPTPLCDMILFWWEYGLRIKKFGPFHTQVYMDSRLFPRLAKEIQYIKAQRLDMSSHFKMDSMNKALVLDVPVQAIWFSDPGKNHSQFDHLMIVHNPTKELIGV